MSPLTLAANWEKSRRVYYKIERKKENELGFYLQTQMEEGIFAFVVVRVSLKRVQMFFSVFSMGGLSFVNHQFAVWIYTQFEKNKREE